MHHRWPVAIRCLAAGLWSCLLLPNPADGQTQYGVDVWTNDNGLPQNIINAIHQTRDGYLWLTTFDGIVRFDGVRFTVFDRSQTPGIGGNRFMALHETVDGDLWFGTENSGVTRYHAGRFATYTTEHSLPHNFVSGITSDASGRVWVLANDRIAEWANGRFRPADLRGLAVRFQHARWDTATFWGADDQRLYRFTRGTLSTWPLAPELRDRAGEHFEQDTSGAVWLQLRDNNLARLREGALEAIHAVRGIRPGTAKAIVPEPWTTYRDRQGITWPIRLDDQLNRHLVVPSATRSEDIVVTALFEDREGNLWLGTNGRGLYRVRRQTVTTLSTQQGLIDRVVYPILQDHSGAIWIGGWETGVSRFVNGRFTNYTTADGLTSGTIMSLAEDRDGRIWVSSSAHRNGGLHVFERDRFVPIERRILPDGALVTTIQQDRLGRIWFGTTQGLVRYEGGVSTTYTRRDGLAGEDVRSIVEDPRGRLWIGAYGGLSRLDGATLTGWTERDGLPSNNIRALYYDTDDTLWIGTYDGGLGRLKSGRFARITTREGLFNNGVFQILDDRRGNLWMTSNRGIYRASKQALNELADGRRRTISSPALGRSDGLLNAECNGGLSPAGIRAADGRLWLPTQDGVAIVDPDSIVVSAAPVPVVIEAFLVDREPAQLSEPIRIAPGQESFEIHYTGLSFINSDRLTFKYRLAGLDRGWIVAGTRRTAYYSHVPPGGYDFTVVAANSDGVFGTTGATIHVAVVPPFWKTRWFGGITFGLLAGLAVTAYRRRIRALERSREAQETFSRRLIESQEAERKRIAAELHDGLGQHLLIIKNQALLGSGSSNGAEASRAQFDEIAASAAQSIDEARRIAYNLRPHHLDRLGLTNAIEDMIEKVSALSPIQIAATIAPIDGCVSKPLEINVYRIVQESLNNLLKHSHASHAWIDIARNDDTIMMTVRDDGKGFDVRGLTTNERPRGFGMSGIAERVAMLGGTHLITSRPGEGTTLTLRVPCEAGEESGSDGRSNRCSDRG
jgi:signal transduction histidine kinase/sugar lactone lactonase YvrE